MGTPVVALGNGRVQFAGWKGGYGRTIQIKHNRTYMTQYAHLSGYAKGIRSGARVRQGQTIGFVGSSGLSTGPHLDFRVQENGRWINPLHLKGGKSEPLPEQYRAEFARGVEGLAGIFESLAAGEAVLLERVRHAIPALSAARLDTSSAS
jgi:murein DD-endopeptidase MepM/ murein hydrolase activator NlpD